MTDLTVKELREYAGSVEATVTIGKNAEIWLNGGREEIRHTIETLTETVRGFSAHYRMIRGMPPGDGYNYAALRDVLERAFEQASSGKGKERHAQDLPFEQQPMQRLIQLYGVGFALGQAGKKAQESMRLPRDRAVHELLGAINYIAGAVIALEMPANDNQRCGCGCNHG